MHVTDVTALRGFVSHDNAHGRHFSFGIRAQAPQFRCFAFGMRQEERARQSLDTLEGHSLLPFEFFPPGRSRRAMTSA